MDSTLPQDGPLPAVRLFSEVWRLPFDDYDFYICGPTPFMRSLHCGLLSLDVSERRIHHEFFGPASVLKEEAKPFGPARRLPKASSSQGSR